MVNLDEHAALIHEEGSRNGEIPATIKKIAIENIVDTGDFCSREENWE